ncbi:hypothetical protein PGT21_018014 [Puccinia graminis f. sp. tritici]|uniref:Uncharacterized protein n=1 Tax=Puccinia graminis f. sp. tritici TaxID=56615 RepID=A0A5B0Q2X5_PUCGR|nr:hypothetical protein PGT21_018014 [Puccinia graminis f. sp. tritici]
MASSGVRLPYNALCKHRLFVRGIFVQDDRWVVFFLVRFGKPLRIGPALERDGLTDKP